MARSRNRAAYRVIRAWPGGTILDLRDALRAAGCLAGIPWQVELGRTRSLLRRHNRRAWRIDDLEHLKVRVGRKGKSEGK
jgi:hypothetical protein